MRVVRPRNISILVGVTAIVFMAVILALAPHPSGGPGAWFAPAQARESAADLTKKGLRKSADTAGLETAEEKASLPVIVGNIIYAALSLTGVIFVILVIYGGFMWMQARGNQEDVTKAKKIIESAFIGIVLIGLAFAITNFVISRITEAQSGTSAAAAP